MKKRRQLTQADNKTIPEPEPANYIGQPSQDLLSRSGGTESDTSSGYESGELSEEEDKWPMSVFPIGQPAEGRDEAERRALREQSRT